MCIYKITPEIVNYHWGKVGSKSYISKLIKNIDKDKNYAELWYGAHPKNPCKIESTNSQISNLCELIKSSPKLTLGENNYERFNSHLPFLFKILSIEKPLSIQMHPDKINAKILHNTDPSNYPDSNHKPEIAVAISEVHILYGFRNISEINKVLEKNPEVLSLLNEKARNKLTSARETNNSEEYLKTIYSEITLADKSNYKKASQNFIQRISKYENLNYHEKLIIQIQKEYGFDDLAIFTSLLLNYIILNPGDAIFTPANTLHAYLKGDLMECMANSDNVIRAGMTPKFQDKENLLKLANYSSCSTDKLNAIRKVNNTQTKSFKEIKYSTNCDDFALKILEDDIEHCFLNNSHSPFLVVVLEGTGVISNKDNSLNIKLSIGEAAFVSAEANEFILSFSNSKIVLIGLP